MRTMEQLWAHFAARVYPLGMSPDQVRQVQQAFYSGAFVALEETSLRSALPEDEAVRAFDRFYREVKSWCELRAQQSRASRTGGQN